MAIRKDETGSPAGAAREARARVQHAPQSGRQLVPADTVQTMQYKWQIAACLAGDAYRVRLFLKVNIAGTGTVEVLPTPAAVGNLPQQPGNAQAPQLQPSGTIGAFGLVVEQRFNEYVEYNIDFVAAAYWITVRVGFPHDSFFLETSVDRIAGAYRARLQPAA